MPVLKFIPADIAVNVIENTKILAAARKAKVDIRFGCGAGRCGTCAVRVRAVSSEGKLTPLSPAEQELLASMGLSLEGAIRLSCQARILEGECEIDIHFQETYDPAQKL